jgi:hypothetical protein
VAECINKTFNERARSMWLHDVLPKKLWVDAVSIVSYLIDQGPSIPLSQRLRKEIWSRNEVNVSYLRVFGCVSYVYIESYWLWR